MRLILRAAAVGDLDAIFDYGVTAHGADAAVAYVKSIDAVMDRLLAHPALGAPREIRPALRSISAGEHRIFYGSKATPSSLRAFFIKRWMWSGGFEGTGSLVLRPRNALVPPELRVRQPVNDSDAVTR